MLNAAATLVPWRGSQKGLAANAGQLLRRILHFLYVLFNVSPDRLHTDFTSLDFADQREACTKQTSNRNLCRTTFKNNAKPLLNELELTITSSVTFGERVSLSY